MKKIFSLSFITLSIFLLLSTIARGAEWILVGRNENGSSFVDKESISFISSNVVRARDKLIRARPEAFQSKIVLYTLVYNEWDCREKRTKMLQASYYYMDGTNDMYSLSDTKWKYVRPGTIEEFVFKYLCENSK